MSEASEDSTRRARAFEVALGRCTAKVRRAWAAQVGLQALAFGLAGGALAALTLRLLWPAWTLASLAAVVAIGLVFLVRAKSPTEAQIVGHIDARAGADALILSAFDALRGDGGRAALFARAERALASDLPLGASRVPTRNLGLAALGALVLFLSLAWPRARVAVSTDVARALEEVEALAEEAQGEDRERLEEAAEEARELREALAEGRTVSEEELEAVERALRESLGSRRRARERAAAAMEGEPAMARALAQGDPHALDDAAAEAAARREEADRARAHEALEEAADEAARQGDERLEQSLLRRRRDMDRIARQAALARRLMEAMPELAGERLGRTLERLQRGEGGELDEALVDAMSEAWSRLSPEERQRLADAIAESRAEAQNDRAREEGEGGAMSAEEYERALRAALEALDSGGAPGAAGGAGAGGIPLPRPGAGEGAGGAGEGAGGAGEGAGGAGEGGEGTGAGEGAGGGAQGAGGPGGGGASAGTGGQTDRLDSETFVARVRPEVLEGAPTATWVEWAPGTGASGEGAHGPNTPIAAGGEGTPVDQSDVPESYAEHVRRYFGGARGEE